MLCLGLKRNLSWYKNDVDWFILVLGVSFQGVSWFGFVLMNFCIKEMLGFYGRCCQNFPKPMFLFLS